MGLIVSKVDITNLGIHWSEDKVAMFLQSWDSFSSTFMLNFGSSKPRKKPARPLRECTRKDWRNGILALLIIMPFLVALEVSAVSTMSGTWVLLWDLRGHLPLLSSLPGQWLSGPQGMDAVWLAVATLGVCLGSLYFGCKWLVWAGYQYGFRNSAIAGGMSLPQAAFFKPLPPRACPPETSVRHQEVRCLIALITGFLTYAWFIVACVVGFYWCSAARAMDTPVTSLPISRVLWWRQAFPEHWPPNIFWRCCAFTCSASRWLGRDMMRAAPLLSLLYQISPDFPQVFCLVSSNLFVFLKLRAVIPLLQLDQLLLDHLQVHSHFVHGFEAFALGFTIVQLAQRGMDLHELQGDLLGGFLNLRDGGGTVHKSHRGPERAGGQEDQRILARPDEKDCAGT
ncbi:MAG: hypothetical protein JWO94_2344 [Verrucomicrobiaceae bacterium]|nr:hypothetical protein [Verrucomicrobiaceae bacterium]